jgi:hypothetical protein
MRCAIQFPVFHAHSPVNPECVSSWATAKDPSIADYITLPNIGLMCLCVLVIGLCITVACTYLSVTAYLRKRESELY